MTVTPIFRSIRDPIGSAARWAVVSVPAHLSARGLAVPVWAALLLPAIALLPLASPWASYILAPVFVLAAGLRLAALVGLWLLRRQASWRETLLLAWVPNHRARLAAGLPKPRGMLRFGWSEHVHVQPN